MWLQEGKKTFFAFMFYAKEARRDLGFAGLQVTTNKMPPLEKH